MPVKSSVIVFGFQKLWKNATGTSNPKGAT
jgi:hypothetical protein